MTMGHDGLVIGAVFTGAARAVPDRPAAVLGDDALTFGELDAAAHRTVRALRAIGVRRGDRVVCWNRTTLDVLPVFVALARIGAVYVPLGPALSAAEATATARVARPALLIADDTVPGAAVGAAIGVPVIGLGTPADPAGAAPTRPAPPVARAAQATAAARATAAAPTPDVAEGPGETDPHVLFFTSGSTGRPKGVILSHRTNVLRTHPGSQLEPRGAMVCPYPLFHMGAWTIALQQWQARDTVVLVARADGAEIVSAVRRHRATRLNCVPAVWQRVLDTLAAEGRSGPGGCGRLESLRFADTGTSRTPPELLAAIAEAAPNAVLRVFYGSTEAGNVAALDGVDVPRKPGSCGVPSPYQDVELGPDGEVCVRGPLLFDGYFDDETATRAVLRDGRYHTGDLATVDVDGYLSIVGRVGELIRTGGEAVAPGEVEGVLAGAEGVREAAVVGLPDPTWGEIICAVVVPGDPANPPDLAALRAACAGRVAAHKHPRRVVHATELPRTLATGQVLRRRLVERIVTEDESGPNPTRWLTAEKEMGPVDGSPR
ncbi:class I adenylate-forming enzyme family protein [Embleya sp. NPDC008237]|uniref:class I adenylate-forming enzyme family protein n=1 Tax=Embleya sp. NPDC008237 TaxID=3363978 RepID=UPI0036E2C981